MRDDGVESDSETDASDVSAEPVVDDLISDQLERDERDKDVLRDVAETFKANAPQGRLPPAEVSRAVNAAVRHQRVRLYKQAGKKLVFRAVAGETIPDKDVDTILEAIYDALAIAQQEPGVAQAIRESDGIAIT
jgi:hypothetical protein